MTSSHPLPTAESGPFESRLNVESNAKVAKDRGLAIARAYEVTVRGIELCYRVKSFLEESKRRDRERVIRHCRDAQAPDRIHVRERAQPQ